MSQVNDWTQTRAQIISRALRLAGVLPTGESTSSDFIVAQTDEAQNALNAMLRGLQNETSQPFRKQVFSVPLIASSQVTGSDGLIYTARKTHTTPNAATRANSTSYTKGDLVFPAVRAGYYYQAQNSGTSSGSAPTYPTRPGGVVTDNDIVWKAFPDTKPSTGSIYQEMWELDGSTGGTYTQNIEYRNIGDLQLDPNVLSVNQVWYRDSNGNDIKIDLIARDEYLGLVDKIDTGFPNKAYFEDSFVPRLKLWPIPESTTYIIQYDCTTIFNDMDNGSDTGISSLNFLNRWIEYLTYELACHLGEEYQLDNEKLMRLQMKADKYKSFAIIKDSVPVDSRQTKGAY